MTALFGPTDAAERAHVLREAGASGVFTFEGPHDVFTPLALAAAVEDLDLMTNVAIAFPRNPIHLAHQANDLQLLTKGRFTLGLGTQVRAQIEKRFGAEFDRPVARMSELVRALRAIFAAWSSGERLDFRGEYYRHTLMTPTFSPGTNPYGPPPIYVGALGPRLTRATAKTADGLLVLAFYGSTPAYRPVLDVHGWGDLQPELNALSKQGKWEEMGKLIDDDMLHTIAACGSPAEIAAHIRDRVEGVSDRICVYQPGPIAVESLAGIVDALNS